MCFCRTLAALLCAVTLSLSSSSWSGDDGPVCDVTNEPGVKYFDIRLQPETKVPQMLTSYICQTQNIPVPMDFEYHAVAFEPIISNRYVMHHMLLFGCTQAIADKPHNCGGSDAQCRSFLVQWSMGVKGKICAFPETGVRFGLGAFKSLALQIHWNNKHLASGLSDASGVRIYYTTRLRKYDVGNFQVGQDDLYIPPGVARFSHTGNCSSNCTNDWLSRPIYLTRAHIHQHYVGDGGILELFRKGQKVQTIVEDTEFDYNNPPVHYFDEPVQVLPGDELKLTCFYNTKDGAKKRDNTIYWSLGSDGEMCYVFITYYPYVKGFDQCIQFDSYDICSLPGGGLDVGGCVFGGFARSFQNFLADDVLKQCSRPSSNSNGVNQTDVEIDFSILCSEKCQEKVKEITDHPCMQGRVGEEAKRVYLSPIASWHKVKKIINSMGRYCLD